MLIAQIFVMNVQLPIIVIHALVDTLCLLDLVELLVPKELTLHSLNVFHVLLLVRLALDLLQIVQAASKVIFKKDNNAY